MQSFFQTHGGRLLVASSAMLAATLLVLGVEWNAEEARRLYEASIPYVGDRLKLLQPREPTGAAKSTGLWTYEVDFDRSGSDHAARRL